MNELINYKGDCRTAPATPGLFNRQGRPVDNKLSTNQLHHFVLPYAKPGQDLEWDKAVVPGQYLAWDKVVINWTRFIMG